MKLRSVAFTLGSVLFLAVTGCSGGGGTTATGGTTAITGGTTGTTGGTMGTTGGTTGNTGGATGSGGNAATGGAIGSGGAANSGGATGTGGATATGGTTTTGGRGGGGATGTGGRGGGGATGTGGRGGTTGTGGAGGAAGSANAMMNVFITSSTSTTGNLGGLAGADTRCQNLAMAVGHGSKTWRAYLSAANPATNAINRIGAGPYYNAQGTMIATDKAALHARTGDAALFLTEQGARVNGQWTNSPTPNQHDILTGTQRDGTLAADLTCGDWTATTGMSQVGHSDGLGPNQATTGTYSYWNSSHTGMCSNTSPGGGAGRIYCFVGP